MDCGCQRFEECGTAVPLGIKGHKSSSVKLNPVPVCSCLHFINFHRNVLTSSSSPVVVGAAGAPGAINTERGFSSLSQQSSKRQDGIEAEIRQQFSPTTKPKVCKEEYRSQTVFKFDKIIIIPHGHNKTVPMRQYAKKDGERVLSSGDYQRFIDAGFVAESVDLKIDFTCERGKPPLLLALEKLFPVVNGYNGFSQGFDFIQKDQKWEQQQTSVSSDTPSPWGYIQERSQTFSKMLIIKLRNPDVTLQGRVLDLTADEDPMPGTQGMVKEQKADKVVGEGISFAAASTFSRPQLRLPLIQAYVFGRNLALAVLLDDYYSNLIMEFFEDYLHPRPFGDCNRYEIFQRRINDHLARYSVGSRQKAVSQPKLKTCRSCALKTFRRKLLVRLACFTVVEDRQR